MVAPGFLIPQAVSTSASFDVQRPAIAATSLRPSVAPAAPDICWVRERPATLSFSLALPSGAAVAVLAGTRQRRQVHQFSRQRLPRRILSAVDQQSAAIEEVSGSIEPRPDSEETALDIAVKQHIRRCGFDDVTAEALMVAPPGAVRAAMRKDFRNSPDPSLAVRQFLREYEQEQRTLKTWKPKKVIDPADIPAYLPGEGYGRNVIPFAGVSPGRGYVGRKKAEEQMQRALEIGEIIRAQKEITDITQEVPVPEEHVDRLQELGWFDYVVEMTGCRVHVSPQHVVEEHGRRWKTIEIVGSEDGTRAGALHLMSALAPRRVASST